MSATFKSNTTKVSGDSRMERQIVRQRRIGYRAEGQRADASQPIANKLGSEFRTIVFKQKHSLISSLNLALILVRGQHDC